MDRFTNYEPHTDARKSFYGKAQEVTRENGDRRLLSYGTPILKITADDELYLTSKYDYSKTTLRHACDFVEHYKKDLKQIGKNTAEFLRLNSSGFIYGF